MPSKYTTCVFTTSYNKPRLIQSRMGFDHEPGSKWWTFVLLVFFPSTTKEVSKLARINGFKLHKSVFISYFKRYFFCVQRICYFHWISKEYYD